MTQVYDCIIIGGGPSGLTAGNILAKSNLHFLVIEKGEMLYNRQQSRAKDIVSGIGGGGLYSDGKISFYPSGSNLYKLKTELLLKAYQKLVDFFSGLNITIQPFDLNWVSVTEAIEELNGLKIKNYISTVLSQEELYKVGFSLYDQIGKDRFLLKHDVTKIFLHENIYLIDVEDTLTKTLKTIKAKNVIFCGGKFGSINLASFIEQNSLIFKKFEFGIRIETENKKFDYNLYKQTDLKLIIPSKKNKEIEFRTFCFCRNGYIVHGEFEGINSFNGVSNKSNFKKMNFGINLRINDEIFFREYKTALSNLQKSKLIMKQRIKTFIKERSSNWNKDIHDYFTDCLLTNFPQICNSDAEITGPSFEYFGYYPILNKELKIPNNNFWVCGDSTGDFRGLLPSLISGYIAGLSVIEKEEKEKDILFDSVRLKVSDTKKTKTIFTAQSKKFFYCKDAICEFVFKKGYTPINPFQVFGYFLNDRVNRDLIRTGNNELISRCDELWVFGTIADGVLFEISRANDLKIPIRFFNVATFANEIFETQNLNDLVFEPEVYAKIPRENLIRFISQYHIYKDEVKEDINQLKLKF
ncbi:MAG: hypothetical protein A2046_07405 [Bacteroidetes bacterium GWA2_30_7]|nr:MAG: hypothetical protein A2046_07405 [Bacteroidetes bacterium GWA2_30_7]